jgi:two-component system copper resistance phosphate regulon response regulator CusR
MSFQRILIVEDEPKVASFIKKGLEENQYEARVAFDGAIGTKMALNETYHAVILDINIPLVNGYEVCREIRLQKPHLPILMLTAFGSTEDKLTGFDSGADDYLVKPFEFRELLARIKALLKRNNSFVSSGNILTIADLEMNIDTKTVIRGTVKIDLTAKEFTLLEYLLRNKGRVISRGELAEKIWEITFDTGTNVIDVYINFLRKKIDKDRPNKLIHTHIGMGYVLKEVK